MERGELPAGREVYKQLLELWKDDDDIITPESLDDIWILMRFLT